MDGNPTVTVYRAPMDFKNKTAARLDLESTDEIDGTLGRSERPNECGPPDQDPTAEIEWCIRTGEGHTGSGRFVEDPTAEITLAFSYSKIDFSPIIEHRTI